MSKEKQQVANEHHLNIKLSLRNYGPIKEAEGVAIRPLTILVGPSNTGKSYFAVLLYSLLQTLSGGSATINSLSRRMERKSKTAIAEPHVYQDKDLPVLKLFDKLHVSMEEGTVDFEDLTMKVQNIINEAIPGLFENKGHSLSDELSRCMGTAPKDLIAGATKSYTLSRHMEIDIRQKNVWKWSLASDEEGMLVTTSAHQEVFSKKEKLREPQLSTAVIKRLLSGLLLLISNEDETTQKSMREELLEQYVEEFFIQAFHGRSLFPWSGTSFYMPAARAGVMQSHRSIVGALISRISSMALEPMQIPMLNGILSDFLQRIVQLGNRQETELADIAKDMEKNILQGAISVETSPTQYPEFFYRKDGLNVPLMRSSSMASELAPIVLFLRHYVNKGDVLIIEEPEAHLHPGAQRDVARSIVRMIRAGVHVVITTHSDYLLEQLSNYIHLRQLSDEKREEITGANDICLDLTEVGAYLFKEGEEGTVVRPMEFDEVEGLIATDHTEVSSALYNQTVDILERKCRQ